MDIVSILTTVLPSVLPALMDGVKMIFSKITGVSMGEPKSFAERKELYGMETDRLKALGAMDNPSGPISKWVADLRASFRYIFVGLIVLVTLAYALFYKQIGVPEVWGVLYQLSGSATFFILGDRVYLGLKLQK
jgi:hypothetical protein